MILLYPFGIEKNDTLYFHSIILEIIRFRHQRPWTWPHRVNRIRLLRSRSKNRKQCFRCRIPDRELLSQYSLLIISLPRLQRLSYPIFSFPGINQPINMQSLVKVIPNLKRASGSSLDSCDFLSCHTRWHDIVHWFIQSIYPYQQLVRLASS